MVYAPGKKENPHPDFLQVLKNAPPPSAAPPNIESIRKWQQGNISERLQKSTSSYPDVEDLEIVIPVRDGTEIPATVVRPSRGDGSHPVIVWYHGGGFSLGSHTDDVLLHRRLAHELGLVVVSVGYRLAPEFAFPTGIQDSIDATKWVYNNAPSIHGNPDKGFLVGGVSAGGNLAAVVALAIRDEASSVKITGQFLSVPNVCPPPVIPEKYRHENLSPVQNQGLSPPDPETLKIMLGPLKADITSPLFNPLLNPAGHANLPRAYFQICGVDGLRDEELIYERVLREDNKTETKIDYYEGLPHAFWEFFPTLESHIAKWEDDSVKGLKWLLSK